MEIGVTQGRPVPQRVFKLRRLTSDEVTECNGLRVTTVARTLVDLGEVVGSNLIERALESALRKRYVSAAGLSQKLAAAPKLHGTSALRLLLAERPPGLPPTDSDAETLFLQLARGIGLPPPERQFPVRTPDGLFRLDFAWPAVRVAVEIDGASTHASRAALRRDLRRQNSVVSVLTGDGWLLLRFTWEDIVDPVAAVRTAGKLRQAWRMGLPRVP